MPSSISSITTAFAPSDARLIAGSSLAKHQPGALPKAVFNDFSTLDALRSDAAKADGAGVDDKHLLEEAASQFSAIFLHMALKSMRQASLGEGLLDSQQSEFYRDMFDEQLSLELSGTEGFGLARLIVDQLSPGNKQPKEPAEVALQAYTQAGSADKSPQESVDPADRLATRAVDDQI